MAENYVSKVVEKRRKKQGAYLLVGVLPVQPIAPRLGVVPHVSEGVHLGPLTVVLSVVKLVHEPTQLLVHLRE